MQQVEKAVLLQTLDHLWREHIVTVEHLRQVIHLRGYGQRDPLNEYKTEGFTLFEAMIGRLREMTTSQIMRVEIAAAARADDMLPDEDDLPPMVAHHIDATDRRGRCRRRCRSSATAGQQARQRPCSIREDPRDLGQGRPQRSLPLRLRQEIQALPRRLRLSCGAPAVTTEC